MRMSGLQVLFLFLPPDSIWRADIFASGLKPGAREAGGGKAPTSLPILRTSSSSSSSSSRP